MEQLPEETRREVVKTSSERMRLRLVREGYDEEEILALNADDLLETLARHILYPPAKPIEQLEGAEGGAECRRQRSQNDVIENMKEGNRRERGRKEITRRAVAVG